MTSRERFIKAINHIETDRPPIDLGATATSGISAFALHNLRQALGINKLLNASAIINSELFHCIVNVEFQIEKICPYAITTLMHFKKSLPELSFVDWMNPDF